MKICCICGQLFEGYGNNPAPIETRGECCDDCNINVVVPRRLLDAKKAQIRAAGFQIKSMPIWVKNNFGIGYYTRPQYEPMYLAIKGNPPPPDTAISDVLNYPRVVKQVHTCEKPIPLLQRLISTFSREGDVIFDGFAGGGGTTAIAARKLRRKYICFELDKNYFDIATSRIENEFAQASFLYD